MKAVKITNPLWLGHIGPRVADFVKKAPIKGIVYETLYNYFVKSIQHGGDLSEFWVVYDEDEAVAYGHFTVRGLPYHGVVLWDNVYSWTKKKNPVSILADRFVEFGKNRRCPLYEISCTSERIYKIVEGGAKNRGMVFQRQGFISAIGR